MPQIIVTADRRSDGEGAVMLRERINLSDFESAHFAAQLVERLGWAVEDAQAAERDQVESPYGGDRSSRGGNQSPHSVERPPSELAQARPA